MGQIDIQEFNNYITWADFFILVIAAFLLLFCWRLLNRWNRKKVFRYWYPTVMLIAVSLLIFAGDHVDSRTKLGTILEWVSSFVFGINLPAFISAGICFGILYWLCLGKCPIWISIAMAAALFWFAWYLLLHFMRMRELDNAPITLNLKVPSVVRIQK